MVETKTTGLVQVTTLRRSDFRQVDLMKLRDLPDDMGAIGWVEDEGTYVLYHDSASRRFARVRMLDLVERKIDEMRQADRDSFFYTQAQVRPLWEVIKTEHEQLFVR